LLARFAFAACEGGAGGSAKPNGLPTTPANTPLPNKSFVRPLLVIAEDCRASFALPFVDASPSLVPPRLL
jgi:hypothetical protein